MPSLGVDLPRADSAMAILTMRRDLTTCGVSTKRFNIRTTFEVPDRSAVEHLTLAADYDDGSVDYINGTEVTRRNLPPGPVDHETQAAEGHKASRGNGESDPHEKEYIPIDPDVLVSGTNVLAVSGHNVSLGSSDLSLIIELYANVNLIRGPFIQMPSSDGITVVWHTDVATDSAVDYGSDTSYSGGTVSDNANVRRHAITLTGLAAAR